jgi:hypothetical protein
MNVSSDFDHLSMQILGYIKLATEVADLAVTLGLLLRSAPFESNFSQWLRFSVVFSCQSRQIQGQYLDQTTTIYFLFHFNARFISRPTISRYTVWLLS